jgi:hypothetical protein
MKKTALIFLCIFFLFLGIFIDRYALHANRAVAEVEDIQLVQADTRTSNNPDQWVAKINGDVITLDEFRREFRVHVFSLPIDEEQKDKYENDASSKQKFLTNLINEYLIYNKAVSEGYDKRRDVRDLIKAVSRRALIQVYLNEKIEPKLMDIPDDQIEAIYNQNKKLFAGVDIDVARQQIKMQMLQRQYNDRLNDIVDQLKGEAKVIKKDNVEL